MNKIITIIIVMILLSINVFAITEKERKDILTYLDKVENDKEGFEVFLAFADAKGYNFYEEKEIKEKIEKSASKFGILLMPYRGIKGINKQEIDKEVLKGIEAKRLKEFAKKPVSIGNYWPVIVILISLIIIIYVLELYRKEKIRRMRIKKKKKQ